MKPAFFSKALSSHSLLQWHFFHYCILFLAGLAAALGFAPFHMPGVTILSLALLFYALLHSTVTQSLRFAFLFGLGFFGLGVSWVIVSIHDFGGLHYFFAALVTLVFVSYLSLFPVAVVYCFKWLKLEGKPCLAMIAFSILWCLGEYLRAHLMTGFPWLLLGTTQIDTPLKYLAPILGSYGLGLLCVFSATLLTFSWCFHSVKRYFYLMAFVLILISPSLLQRIQWITLEQKPITVAAVQGNLSMRDKWDERLFKNLLHYYAVATKRLLKNQLIILPESAIPLPANYLHQYLMRLHKKVLKANSALILGILQPANESETHYYNAMTSYGHAKGQHLKRQLVPFGEYIPKPLIRLYQWLHLPEFNVIPGTAHEKPIKIFNHPIASLICYEVAFPQLLAKQMPKAEWIVSISDNGWFGHSLASYQQVQMSQMLSLLVGRYQVVVNNDGLSSVIDNQGNIVEGLPPFSSGFLQAALFPAHGATPWVIWNDRPVLIFCLLWALFLTIHRICRFRRQ